MFTLQETFDMAVAPTLAQGCQSRLNGTSGGCAYRGKGPKGETVKCVAGHLMPDEDYKKSFDQDGCSVESFPVKCIYQRLGHDISFLVELQRIHDSWKFTVADWPEAFSNLAKRHNLSDKVVQDFLERKKADVENS